MFKIKNNSDSDKVLFLTCPGARAIPITFEAGKVTGQFEDKYRSFFEQNEVDWATIIPIVENHEAPELDPETKVDEIEEVEKIDVVESLGSPELEKPKGRPRGKGDLNVHH